MIMYNIIFKEVIMLLPEGSEFKAWLEKWVALLRRHAVKSIEQFINEIEAKIEEKEWGPTAEKLKVFAKKEPNDPISAVSEISDKAKEAIAAFRTTENLDTDRKIRTQFKEVAEKLEGNKEYIKVKFSDTDEFKETCNKLNKAPEEICNYCFSWVCRVTHKMDFKYMPGQQKLRKKKINVREDVCLGRQHCYTKISAKLYLKHYPQRMEE